MTPRGRRSDAVKVVSMERTGGPEVLEPRYAEDLQPGPGKVVVDVAAIGVNLMDVGTRRGMNAMPLPLVPGVEGAGRIAALGDGATGLTVGQRVAWAYVRGRCASKVVMPATSVVPAPMTSTTSSRRR
jgi:NADPH2:quinone reductase